MFDKRILALIPEARRLVVGAVALKWAALLMRVVVLVGAGMLLGGLMGGEVGTGSLGFIGSGAPGAGGLRFTPLVIGAVMLVAAVLSFASEAAARHVGSRAAAAAKAQVRRLVFHKLIDLGPSFEEHVAAGEAVQVVGEGVEQLESYFGRYLPQLFFAVLAPVTLFALLLPVSVPVALTLLVCVPLIPVSIVVLMKRARRAMGAYWGSYVDLGADFLDAIRGLTTLKVYRADAAAHERLNARAEEFRAATMRLLRVQLNSVTLMDLFTYGGAAAGLAVALLQCAAGSLQPSQVLVIALLAVEFFLPMRTLGSYFHTGMGAQGVIDRVFSILDAPVAQRGTATLGEGPVDLVCEGVGFSYIGDDGGDAAGSDVAACGAAGEGAPATAETCGASGEVPVRRALHDVTLVVEDGSFVGVTGVSGSGKTTLADVLCGRHDAYEGSVRLGGVELRDLDAAALHRTVTYVGAHSHVFRGSVRSNLLLGNAQASDPQMWEALKRCRLHQDVLAMGGLDAEVAEGGSNLSGGQRQRLAVARACLHDTPVYVFDEATSNIDAASETAILEFIQELALTKTVVVVSHRLAALRWTDRIYVLEEGTVAEAGEHGALLRAGGVYARLWTTQAELERFARAAEDHTIVADAKVAAGPVISEAQAQAMEQMPAKVADLMYMAIEAKPIREAILGRTEDAHPSWIPRPEGSVKPGAAEGTAVPGASSVPGADGQSTGGPSPAGEDATRGQRSAWQVVRGLAGVTRAQVPALLRACLLGTASNLAAAALPAVAVAGALGVAGAGCGLPLGPAIALLVACGLARGPLRYGERLGTHDQTFRTLALVRDRVFGAMRRLAPAKLQRRDVGDLVALVTADVELLEAFYARAVAPFVSALVTAAVAVLLLALVAPALAPLAAVEYALIGAAVPVVANRMLDERGRSIRERAVFMQSFILDTLHGLAEVLQFGWAEERSAQMDERMDDLMGDEGGFGRATALAGALGGGLALVFTAACALLAGGLVSSGALDAGAAVLGCVVFACSLAPFVDVSQVGASFHQTVAAGERILDLLDEEPETPDVADGVSPQEFTGAALRDVDFSYGGQVALLKANLALEQGRVTAVTGPSGSGKSTLVKLLMRFWDAQAGTVEVAGADVRGVTTERLRELEGYMEQTTYLFAGTLRENIAFVRPGATDGELAAAIEKASLAEFVKGLPLGFDTPVAQGGAGVSDGERQRIGLARLFLYDPPLLLLDEPTSNLDTVNEAAVLHALHEQRAGRTVLVVSHRPSTASIADVVYRMGG